MKNMENLKNVFDENGVEIINELVSQITKWKIEASSNHNDGWTRKHYQEKIDRLKSAMNKAFEQDDESLDNYD